MSSTPEPIHYADFRTGLTFKAVREILSVEQKQAYDRGVYMFVGRSTVLGRWFQYKREMYEDYMRSFREMQRS